MAAADQFTQPGLVEGWRRRSAPAAGIYRLSASCADACWGVALQHVRSANAIAANGGFQSGSEYTRSQLETSAAQKESFFARRQQARAAVVKWQHPSHEPCELVILDGGLLVAHSLKIQHPPTNSNSTPQDRAVMRCRLVRC